MTYLRMDGQMLTDVYLDCSGSLSHSSEPVSAAHLIVTHQPSYRAIDVSDHLQALP